MSAAARRMTRSGVLEAEIAELLAVARTIKRLLALILILRSTH